MRTEEGHCSYFTKLKSIVYLLLVYFDREPFQLPWGARRAHNEGNSEEDRPGAFVLRKLFTDFTRLAGRKIEQVLAEPLVSLWDRVDIDHV